MSFPSFDAKVPRGKIGTSWYCPRRDFPKCCFLISTKKKLVMLMLLENSDIMENESEEGHLKEKWDHFVTIFDDRRFEDCCLDFKLMTLLIKMCTSAECCMLVSSAQRVLKGRRLRTSEFIIDIVNRLTLRRRGDWWSRWQEISSRKQRNSSIVILDSGKLDFLILQSGAVNKSP